MCATMRAYTSQNYLIVGFLKLLYIIVQVFVNISNLLLIEFVGILHEIVELLQTMT